MAAVSGGFRRWLLQQGGEQLDTLSCRWGARLVWLAGQAGAPHAAAIAQRVCALPRRLALHADSRAARLCCGEIKQARRQSALCRTSAAVCSHVRAAGTVLISTTNLVTLPAPPSCYCVCRLQPPPLCAACSAFAAAVALLVTNLRPLAAGLRDGGGLCQASNTRSRSFLERELCHHHRLQ